LLLVIWLYWICAKKHQIKTVALCGVSTGIFGYPLVPASRIALQVVREWLETDDNADSIDLIIICTFLQKEKDCYKQLTPQYFPIVEPQFNKSSSESDDDDNESEKKKTQSNDQSTKNETDQSQTQSSQEKKIRFFPRKKIRTWWRNIQENEN